MPSTPGSRQPSERSPLVAGALEKARGPTPARSATAAVACPTSSTRWRSPTLLAEHGYPDEVLAAALLHDVVEDSETTIGEICASLRRRVAGMVAALTDDESIDAYRERKEEHGPGRRRRRRRPGDLRRRQADQHDDAARRATTPKARRWRDEFKVPLELKLEVWEADLELLREQAPELALPRRARRRAQSLCGRIEQRQPPRPDT